jgi:hypothetical protein
VTAALVRYETRRVGWAALSSAPAVLAAGALIAGVLTGKGNDAGGFIGFWLSEMVPLAFGVAVAGLPAAERCLEVQLSLPTSIARTLARRTVLCGLWSGLTVLCLAMAAGAVGVWRPAHGILVGQLTWLSPALALAGIAATAFVGCASATGAAAVVAGLWLFEDLTKQWFIAAAWARPLYLFVDDTADVPAAWWWANRLVLAVLGGLLLALAAIGLRLRREQLFATRMGNRSEDS